MNKYWMLIEMEKLALEIFNPLLFLLLFKDTHKIYPQTLIHILETGHIHKAIFKTMANHIHLFIPKTNPNKKTITIHSRSYKMQLNQTRI